MDDRKPHTNGLFDAATVGDFNRVRQLTQAGAQLNVVKDGDTLLTRIIEWFTMSEPVPPFASKMLHMLLELGADPNLPGDEGMTAVHTTMLTMNTDLMRLLLEAGATPNCMPGLRDDSTLYDWAEEDYRYSVWFEPCGSHGDSLYPPDKPTADDKANEDAWLQFLDRCAVKYGVRRPDYLLLLREFGARTAEELKTEQ